MAKAQEREMARLLYVEQGLDAKEVAQMLKVSELTMSKWVNANNAEWKNLKAARTLSPDKLIRMYYEQSEAIVQQAKDDDRPISSGDADALNKLASAIQKLDKKIDPSITMSVLRNFNNYLIQINPELAKQCAAYQMEFVQSLLDAQK